MSELSLKWRKNQNTSFASYKQSGIYNFYLCIDEIKAYNIRPFNADGIIKYRLEEVHQEPYKEPTYQEELGVFDTSLQAKKFAENIING